MTIPPIGSSNHYGLLTKFAQYTGHRPTIQAPRRIWRYKYANYELANDLLFEPDPSTIIVDEDVNRSWKNWNNKFLNVIEQCIPHGRLPVQKKEFALAI